MSSHYDSYYSPASAHRGAAHPPPWAMGAPMYVPAPGPGPYLAQPVKGPDGQEMFARRHHGSTVIEPINHERRKKFNDRKSKNPNIKEREYYGYAVHGDQVVYIPKKKRGQYRVLHANQHDRGEKYLAGHKGGDHRKRHEENKKKRKVRHPILKTLSDACKQVGKQKKDKSAFPDSGWMGTVFSDFFTQLNALKADFTASRPPFDAKPEGKVWPSELTINSISVGGDTDAAKYVEFAKEKRKLFSELKKLIGSSQNRHRSHAVELSQAKSLAEKNGMSIPDANDPRALTSTVMGVTMKMRSGNPIVLPKNRELQDRILSEFVRVTLLAGESEGENSAKISHADVLEKLKGIVPEGVRVGLLDHPDRLKHILQKARSDKKRIKNNLKKQAASAIVSASEAKLPAAAGATPSLVSMLYHR